MPKRCFSCQGLVLRQQVGQLFMAAEGRTLKRSPAVRKCLQIKIFRPLPFDGSEELPVPVKHVDRVVIT